MRLACGGDAASARRGGGPPHLNAGRTSVKSLRKPRARNAHTPPTSTCGGGGRGFPRLPHPRAYLDADPRQPPRVRSRTVKLDSRACGTDGSPRYGAAVKSLIGAHQLASHEGRSGVCTQRWRQRPRPEADGHLTGRARDGGACLWLPSCRRGVQVRAKYPKYGTHLKRPAGAHGTPLYQGLGQGAHSRGALPAGRHEAATTAAGAAGSSGAPAPPRAAAAIRCAVRCTIAGVTRCPSGRTSRSASLASANLLARRLVVTTHAPRSSTRSRARPRPHAPELRKRGLRQEKRSSAPQLRRRRGLCCVKNRPAARCSRRKLAPAQRLQPRGRARLKS